MHRSISNNFTTHTHYLFNGMEADNEVSGNGNSYTAEFWQYSSRLGKRWNIDPVIKHHESPYACFANNPIWFTDPNGADTLDLNVTNNKMKELGQMAENLKDRQSNIWKMIYNHNQNVDKVEKIEINQNFSEKAAEGNNSPHGLILEGLNKINEYGILSLKGKLLEETNSINKAIESYNSDLNIYNTGKLEMEMELKTCDALGLKTVNGELYVNKSISAQPAAVRYDINGKHSRFGITKTESPKIFINLPKLYKINPIKYSPYTLEDVKQDILDQALDMLMKK